MERRGTILFVGIALCYSSVRRWFHHKERIYLKRTIPDVRPEYRSISIPELSEQPTELIWGASFALLVYQMGIAHAICNENDHQLLLRKLIISGVSGGSATAGYMIATLHGIGDMDYWYRHHVMHIVAQSSTTYSIRNWATTIWNGGYEYYRICHVLGMNEIDWKRRYRIIATHIRDFTLRVLNTFPNAQSFADGIASSSFLPGIISSNICFQQCDTQNEDLSNSLIDGGFGFNFTQYNPDNHIVHFSLRHSKHVYRKSDIYERVHYSILEGIDLVNDNLGIISSCDYADAMFICGYNFGIRNMDTIRKALMLV